jgi:tellurite resistance protein TerC
MTWFWIGFFALVAILLVLDLGVFHRTSHDMRFKEAVGWTIFWMSLGLSFGALVYCMYEYQWFGAPAVQAVADGAASPHVKQVLDGSDALVLYLSAYLLEQSLSIDNIFVISLIFTSFRIKPRYQHRILFWGILGAIFFRCAMLGGGVWLVGHFTWIFYVFGGYLVWAGIKMFLPEDDSDGAIDKSWTVRFLRRVTRVVDTDDGGRFLTQVDGKRALTILGVTVIVVEMTDIVFALDSIPAVLVVTQESFIVITSNIFAILGLRSLYFVLAGAMKKFHYLKIALAVLLMLIGGKMLAHDFIKAIPHWVSLIAIVVILGSGVAASLLLPQHDDDDDKGKDEKVPGATTQDATTTTGGAANVAE